MNYPARTFLWRCLSSSIFAIASGMVALLTCGSAALDAQAAPSQSAGTGESQAASTSTGASDSLSTERNARYTLRRGDIFDLVFPFTPDFNQEVTVQPDGFITLNGLGDLQVMGRTVPDVKTMLQAEYAKILHEPVINLVLKDFQKPYFIASGEVARPGKYEMRGDTTLTEAIAIAGGFTEKSKHSQVLLFRNVSNQWVTVRTLDVKKMFQAKNLSEDLDLKPGDMFFVPQNRMSKIGRYIPSPGVGMTVTPVP